MFLARSILRLYQIVSACDAEQQRIHAARADLERRERELLARKTAALRLLSGTSRAQRRPRTGRA